jgi:hypothetical protein
MTASPSKGISKGCNVGIRHEIRAFIRVASLAMRIRALSVVLLILP